MRLDHLLSKELIPPNPFSGVGGRLVFVVAETLTFPAVPLSGVFRVVGWGPDILLGPERTRTPLVGWWLFLWPDTDRLVYRSPCGGVGCGFGVGGLVVG